MTELINFHYEDKTVNLDRKINIAAYPMHVILSEKLHLFRSQEKQDKAYNH